MKIQKKEDFKLKRKRRECLRIFNFLVKAIKLNFVKITDSKNNSKYKLGS